MTKLLLLAAAALAAGTAQVARSIRASAGSARPAAHVTLVEGNATRFSPGATPLAIASGAKLSSLDVVKTALASRVELRLPDRSIVRIGPESEMAMEELVLPAGAAGGKSVVKLATGRLWARILKVKGADTWNLRVGASILGVRGTTFGVRAGADGGGEVRLYEGSLEVWRPGGGEKIGGEGLRPKEAAPPHREVAASEWARTLAAGQMLQIPAAGAPPEPAAIPKEDPAELDEWARWNRERDAAADAAGSPAIATEEGP